MGEIAKIYWYSFLFPNYNVDTDIGESGFSALNFPSWIDFRI